MSKDVETPNPFFRDTVALQRSRPVPNFAPVRPSASPKQVQGLPEETFATILWRIVWARRWTVLAFTFIVTALVLTASLLMKPKYEAVAQVVVVFHGENDTGPLGFKGVDPSLLDDPEDHAAIDTQIAILKTDELALLVIKDLHLDTNPKFSGTVPQKGSDERLLKLFHSSLTVSRVKGTRLIEIRFSSTDPQLAADVVNALSKDYEDQYYRSRFQMSSQITQFLTDQLQDLQAKVRESERRLVDYERENSLFGMDDKQNIVTEKLDDLNKDLTAAEAERVQAEVNYRLARSGQPELLQNIEPGSLLNKLRSQEADLQSQIAQAAVQLGPANPKMAELTGQLEQVQRSISAEAKRIGEHITYQYQSALGRENILTSALEAQKQAASQLNAVLVQEDILKHEFETNRTLYEGLLQKQKELAISSSLKSSTIWPVDKARPPERPSQPKILLNVALSLVFGVFGGVLLAFGLSKLNEDTINTLQQARESSSLPALGMVPLLGTKPRNGAQRRLPGVNSQVNPALVSLLQPMSFAAESYKAVLTALLLSEPTPPTVIQVTSSLPQEGKTTVSTNLAILLARLHRRVLLVDADLRRPRVHQALRLKANTGLCTLLRDAADFGYAAVTYPNLPNFVILPAGPVNLPDDTELLACRIKDLIKGWRKQFDHIVIDTPPVLPVTDSVRISVEADAVILVVRSGQIIRETFLRAQDMLLKVNARGLSFVLNGARLESSDYQSYLHYYGEDQPKRLRPGA